MILSSGLLNKDIYALYFYYVTPQTQNITLHKPGLQPEPSTTKYNPLQNTLLFNHSFIVMFIRPRAQRKTDFIQWFTH